MNRLMLTALGVGFLIAGLASAAQSNAASSNVRGKGTETTLSVQDWQIVGEAPTIVTNSTSPIRQSLVIPAGSQIFRTLPAAGSTIILSVSLKPAFGDSVASSSAIEFGPGLLWFARSDKGGQISFIAGADGATVPVSPTISLAADGSSTDTVAIQVMLDFARQQAVVSVQGQTKLIALSDAPMNRPVTVAVSAGDMGSVRVDSLAVTTFEAPKSDTSSGAAPASSESRAVPPRTSQSIGSATAIGFSGITVASESLVSVKPLVGPTPSSSLEIFTPSVGFAGHRLTTPVTKQAN